MDWGSAANVCGLPLSEYTVQVQEIIAARCNNYCSALKTVGFSLTLTDQCTCAPAMWSETVVANAD